MPIHDRYTYAFIGPFCIGPPPSLMPARLAANAFSGSRFGDFSTATNQISFSNGPLVRSVVTSAQELTWGESVTITAPVVDGGSIRAVTFFYDADQNGRWSQGIDTDLGADFNGANGWSISATVSSAWMVTHFGYFVANAVSTSGAWGTIPRISNPVTIFDRPRLSEPTVSSPGLIAPNTIIKPCMVVNWLKNSGWNNCRPG